MMRASTLSLLTLAPLAAYAQNVTLLTGLVQALQTAGLTETVAVATSLNGTILGQSLLANISNGDPHLIFAPNDAAWSTVSTNITGNATLLTDVFAYHIVQGNFTGVSTVYPNTTIGQTLFNDPLAVHLEGGKPQALAWAVRADNQTHVLNQLNDTTVLNVTTFENLTIAIIDHVLNIPDTLNNTVPTNNNSLSEFETLLQDATLAFFNSSTNTTSDITFFDAFNTGYQGFTLFSPNNSAIDTVNTTLQGLISNRSAINGVLFNHLINATTLYSPLLTGSQNFTSQAGSNFSFSINSTGQYVTQGNITALIIQPDILLPNGVVHIIDTVLLNTEGDPNAAASALSSAVSAASTATASQTGPVGFTATQSLGGPSSINITSATPSSSSIPSSSIVPSSSSIPSSSIPSSSVIITSSATTPSSSSITSTTSGVNTTSSS